MDAFDTLNEIVVKLKPKPGVVYKIGDRLRVDQKTGFAIPIKRGPRKNKFCYVGTIKSIDADGDLRVIIYGVRPSSSIVIQSP